MGYRVHDGVLVVIDGKVKVLLDEPGVEQVGEAAPCPIDDCAERFATQEEMDEHLAWHKKQKHEARQEGEVYIVTTLQ